MITKLTSICFAIYLLLIATGCTGNPNVPHVGRDTLMQVSTIDALMAGTYDGIMETGNLKQFGDFGLGTIDKLDGEMIELDGVVFQIRSDGTVEKVSNNVTIPFAAVTYFDPDVTEKLDSGMNMAGIQKYVDGKIPTVNIFYAIKIKGSFSYMKTRSVPAQTKPYPVLSEVTKNQSIFEFKEVSGTIVGFRCPPYIEGVNVPGFHLHFLNDRKNAGGHILDFVVKDATVYIDETSGFLMQLPGPGSGFYRLDLSDNNQQELQKVEK
jgi:acetolactate decarboxylase